MEAFGIFSGLAVGLLFGIALQKGRFCMNSAFRDPLVFKDFTLLKAVALALFVNMIAFHLLALAGVIELAPKDFYLFGTILGGFIFGIGMVLAGGCASGTAYRVGEGMVSSMIALAAFASLAFFAKDGFLVPITNTIQDVNLGPVTLSSATGLPTLIFVALFGALGLYLLFKYKETAKAEPAADGKKPLFERIFRTGWNWKLTGITIAVISVLAFIASAAAGRNYPLGITSGFETMVASAASGQNLLTWESFEVMGLVVGAFIAAFIANEFKIRKPPAMMAVQSLAGGALMGLGAIIAGGCNIGHILSGVPQLAVASIVAGAFIILGGWTAAYMIFMRGEK